MIDGMLFDNATFDETGSLKALQEFKWTYEGAIASGNKNVADSLKEQATAELEISNQRGVPLEWHVREDQLRYFKEALGPDVSKNITWKTYASDIR